MLFRSHNGNSFFLTKSCFRFCRCTSGNIEQGGNAFQSYGNFNSSIINIFNCWKDYSSNGDSTFHTFNGIFNINEYNSSYNYFSDGSSCGGVIHNSNSNTKISFYNVLHSKDYTFFESCYTMNPLMINSNIINNTIGRLINIYTPSSSLLLEKCSIFSNSKNSILGSVSFNNCFGDFAVTGILQTSKIYQSVLGFSKDCYFELEFSKKKNQFNCRILFSFYNIFLQNYIR